MTPVDVQSEQYSLGDYSVPSISASASVDDNGILHITLSNANPHKDIPVKAFVRGIKVTEVSGRVLQGNAMNAHNTFEMPGAVEPSAFTGATLSADGLEIVMPKMSVVALEAK
jgi:alpha-N-arabinofuranosidase